MDTERSFSDVRTEKIKVITAIAVSVLLLTTLPVYAWFSNQRSMARLTEISPPNELYIRAGNEEDAAYIDLSEINVEDKSKQYKDVVFCVKGDDIDAFDLQLAYTTNIPFDYSIYYAKPAEEGEITGYSYESPLSKTKYYYVKDTSRDLTTDDNGDPIVLEESEKGRVDIVPKNKSGDIALSSGYYHDQTYNEDGDSVQSNAEPVYWLKKCIDIRDIKKNNEFTMYFILHISWDNLSNNKETDMVYITVARAEIANQENGQGDE